MDRTENRPPVALRDARLSYRSGEVVPVRDVSLVVPSGSFTTVTGPSGAGKTSLLSLIGCLVTPTAGSVEVTGREVGRLSDRERSRLRAAEVGFVFQHHNLLPRLTAVENVALPLLFDGVARSPRRERARELLGRVGLADRTDHLPTELSGGERQRVAVARAFANRPSVVLADEPTGSVDRDTGDRVLELFQRFHADGHTILLVTHDPEVARHGGSRLFMRGGRLRREPAPDWERPTPEVNR